MRSIRRVSPLWEHQRLEDSICPIRPLGNMEEPSSLNTSKIVSIEDCRHSKFKWLTLKRIHWRDPTGRERVWETSERTTRRGAVDACAVAARISYKGGKSPLIPIVSQFRPSLDAVCLEFPAGLVDSGETPAEAALRELKEETGYCGTVKSISPIICSDPGMTSANMCLVTVEIDGDLPENLSPECRCDEGEFICVHLLNWHTLLPDLLDLQEKLNCAIDARLYSFAQGLNLR